MTREGSDPLHGTPEEFGRIVAGDIVKWAKVVKPLNIKPD